MGPADWRRLRDEEGRYREIKEGQRRHLAQMDVPLVLVGVAASDRAGILVGLAPYRSAIDLRIGRVLASPDTASLVAVGEAAAP